MPAQAWQSEGAATIWGTAAGENATANHASAELHTLAGQAAAQVNAAELGLLLTEGISVSMTNIGAQNLVSTTIIGDSNDVDVDVASQEANNTGDVTTTGTVSVGAVNQ